MKNICNTNDTYNIKCKPNKAKLQTNVTELANQQPNKKFTPPKKQNKAVIKIDIANDTKTSNEKTADSIFVKKNSQQKQQQQARNWYRSSCHSYGQNNSNSKLSTTGVKIQSNLFTPKPFATNYSAIKKDAGNEKDCSNSPCETYQKKSKPLYSLASATVINITDNLNETVASPCSKCSSYSDTLYRMLSSPLQMQRIATTYSGSYRENSKYRRYSIDRNYAESKKDFVPILAPTKPVWSGTNIVCVLTDIHRLTLIQRIGKSRISFPLMQCGTLGEETPNSTYHEERSKRMDVFQIDDGFHSDGGTETPPPSPISGSSIASTSNHGSMDNVDTGGAQRLAVLSFEQVRKLNDVMDDIVYIHGRGNFPTLEVKLKDLVNLVRRKLEIDICSGGAGVIVKDVRLNGGAASHVLASEDQPYNDLDLIYAIELTSSRHFDRVKNAVLNTLMDLLPDATSKHRIMPCALKEAYVGKMVKVNNNNDGDRWSLISLGSKRGHKNVELKFVDTMRRQFEFSVDSFQINLDSLLLFYDCAALPISENFYPTVVGESVYGDFQEAMYHLQKKLISTRHPEEIRGGGLLKYCNLLVRNYAPIDPQQMKTQERYMCSRFFIDFPDIATQTLKLDGYLADHFCGIDEEPLQYQYLMHLRDVVEMSTVCLMGHERRQTLLLIQYLAAQVLYKDHQRQQSQVLMQYEQQHHQHHPQQHQVVMDIEPQLYVTHHQQQVVDIQQPQPMYMQQQQQQQQRTVKILEQIQQQQQLLLNTTSSGPPPQTIQIPSGPLGLIYANGVYYAPVIPATICTCNSSWVST